MKRILSVIELLIIIAIICLTIIYIKKSSVKVIDYKDNYVYYTSKDVQNQIISTYMDYKQFVKDYNIKKDIDEYFFNLYKLYVVYDKDAICKDEEDLDIEVSFCPGDNIIKSYKYVSCLTNCEKDGIIYMIKANNSADIKIEDIKVSQIKKYRTCN